MQQGVEKIPKITIYSIYIYIERESLYINQSLYIINKKSLVFPPAVPKSYQPLIYIYIYIYVKSSVLNPIFDILASLTQHSLLACNSHYT